MKIVLDTTSLAVGAGIGALAAVSLRLLPGDIVGPPTFVSLASAGLLAAFGGVALVPRIGGRLLARPGVSADRPIVLGADAVSPLEWLGVTNPGVVKEVDLRSLRDAARVRFAEQVAMAPDEALMSCLVLVLRIRQRGQLFSDIVTILADEVEAARKSGGVPDFGGFARDWSQRTGDTADILTGFRRHHYSFGAVLAEFEQAWRSGLVAASEFCWLKSFHRSLWYAISNVGRAVCFIEGAGVTSHYLAEIAAGGPLATPAIDDAVRGFEDHIKKHLGAAVRV